MESSKRAGGPNRANFVAAIGDLELDFQASRTNQTWKCTYVIDTLHVPIQVGLSNAFTIYYKSFNTEGFLAVALKSAQKDIPSEESQK